MKSADRLGSAAQQLLKIARTRCDELNTELSSIQIARSSTETALAQLDHSVLQEQHRAEKLKAEGIDPDGRMGAQYTEKMQNKRIKMQATLAQLDARETLLKEELSTSYAEIKKFERLVEISERQRQKKHSRRDAMIQDDMALMRYGR